ncbi:unnamed protein product [Hermetia illucens]|uniref:Farnesoic acid O-methyl transferase domain-containing protein n=1 Tax=Hermetia illucens TaxID=343691 RepID=A0A7R8UDG6_HERIL|nr:uncharacterized protein LOC119650220 isoform X2 [Hermetia illucens]CAD7078763.1 unnamed protein product [Hermetia illucens]
MPIELQTPDELVYKFYPVAGGVFNFKIRAPNDAHLALTSGPSESDPMLEVFLGGWGNTKSVIRRNRTKPDVVEVETPNILNAGEFRGFWVRWFNGIITVGREGEAAAFMSYEEQTAFPINYVGVCTGWGASGSWMIEGGPEFKTADCLTYNFRPVNNGCALIQFRGKSNCHIGLMSSKSEENPICELILGGWENTASVIRVNRVQPDRVRKDTPNLVSADRFTTFYVSWVNGHLTVRKDGPKGGIIIEGKDCVNFPVRFLAVRTGWGATGQWKITINENDRESIIKQQKTPGLLAARDSPAAPTLPTPQGWTAPPPTGSGPGCWVPASGGQVPPEAVPGGMDGEQLYIARARHESALIPGKLVPSHGVAYISWGGAEHPCTEYEVLCAGGGQWVPTSGGNIPPQAMPAGESEDGEPLFVGRVNHAGTITPGKVHPSHGFCYIPYGGQEMAFADYEILVSN